MKNMYFNLNQLASKTDGEPTVNRQSRLMSLSGKKAEKEQLSPTCLLSASFPLSFRSRYLRYAAMIFCVLTMSVGQAWGTNGDVLFNQGFGSATAVAYSENTTRSYSTSSTLSGLVGTGDNLFQGAQCNNKKSCGIAINTTSGANSYTTAGTFQAYANNTSFKWALYKTTNFATTAPTAIKFEMDVTPKYIDNKQALAVVVGSGFSVGTSKPAWTAGYTGFNIITNSTKIGKIYIGKVGGTTSIQETTGMTSGTNYHITWVINATGDDLTYTGPDSKSYTLATAKWDMWVGTTRIISGQDRTKTGGTDFSGTTMQNLYIGNDVTGKHEVIIDNVKVTDLTPDPCDAADLTASNITSNGNQEAGTGITFSKVGSPASGDTWYWQTSATGTDKTYNATSPYTTATTAGSYTVYLRAYNTAGNCWGTAASMTNTIYPAPSAMIHNTFAVNDAWSSTIATQDKTNITGLNAMAAVGESVGSGSNKSGLTQKIPSQSSEDAGKYMSLSFNVASGKQLNVTSVVFDEQPVDNTGTFKVSISDNQGSATKTQTIASDAAGSKHTLTLDGDIVGSFKGTVTVKVWAYGWNGGYRFGDYFYIHGTVTDAAACTAPSSVAITGTNKYLGGQTISLTATPSGGSGTATYQWQKEINSVWTNLENGGNISGATSANLQISSCGHGNAGQYRCIVSTGATCSRTSSAYGVHVFSIYGKYYSGEYSHNEITWTSGTTGTATIHLNASSTYLFKIWSNDGYYYGNGENNYIIQPVNWDCGTGNHEMRLFTGPEGDYTFTVNIEHGLDGSPYVNLQVAYPSVTHPVTGYVYLTKWWSCYPHFWDASSNALSPNGYDPLIATYTTICGTDYWYMPALDNYTNVYFKDNATWASATNHGDETSITGNSGKYYTHDGNSWGWHEFTTYTVTTAPSPAGYGTVSAASVTGVACGTSISTSSNTLTVGATSVTATATESGAQYTYAFDGWTWTPAGSTVTSDVTATANFTRTLNSYTVTWKNGATTLETDASVDYGATPSYDGSTPTKDADALYTYTFSGWSPAIGTVTGDATYSAQFTATPKTVAYGDATIYAYNDSKRVVSGTRKTAMATALGSSGENGISGSLPLLHSVAGLTSVVLAGQCKSEVKASFPWLGSYIKMKTDATTATIAFNVASGYAGTATIYFSAYSSDKAATLTNGANSASITSDKKSVETEGNQTSKNIALVSGANTLTISGNNGYISRIDVALEASCTSVAAPTSLTCSAQTSSSLTFTWEKAANASGYVASLYGNSACTGDPVASSVLGDVATVTFSTLTASTTYYCKVQSKGDGSTYCATGGTTSAASGTTDAACSAHGLTYASTSVEKNVGDAAFTNTLTNPNSLSVSYSSSETGVATVNATSGLVTIVGAGSTTITATWAGNATYCAGIATYTLTVSSDCTPQSLVKTQLTSVNAGTTTGYNDGQYAGDPVIATFEDTKVDGGYKLKGNSKLFVTLKGGFVADDKINIVVTQASDYTNVGKLLIFYDASTPKLLTTIDAASAGTYTYTLTAANITTLGSTTTIGVYRPSSGDEVSNPLVKSVEVEGCREWASCTAPDAIAVGSVTATGATFTITDAENTNNYEIYYSESSTAPTAETSATVSGISSKSRAVTGLEAETTYYYWVRSNCGGTTKSSWVAGTPTSFTTSAAAATHNVTYNGNGSTGGSVPTDATAYEEGDVVTVLGNTGSFVKTGQTFLGWSTNATASSGTFYPAGYKFEMPAAAVNLYAVWGSTGATCVTITDFETNSYSKSSNKPDSEGYYFYGYKGTKDAAHAVTITTPSSETRGSNKGADMMIRQNTRFSIYADNTTTGGTPQTFSNVTSVSFKIKAVKDTRIPTIDVYVGSTKIKTVTGGSESSDTDGHEYDTSGFTTITVSDLSNLAGIVKFVNTSSGSSDYKAYFDDIQICYGSGAASGYTVSFDMKDHGSAIADIENVPSGSKIGAPVPAPTAVDYDFGGWYKDDELSDDWDFANDQVTVNTTLYAKWSNCAPTISAHPAAATYTQGAAATALSVTASGKGLNYQWYTSENDDDEDISGSSAIPGATSASYTPSTSLLGTIYYFCVVSNTCGNVVSKMAAITVNDSKLAPTANWTIDEPTHGGKGFTFSIEVNKNNGENWDGELLASMLTLSSEAVLDESSIVVSNTNKTISGTYGVKGSATSPVTFYLLLPATDTQAAARLDHDQSFAECAGAGSGTTYNIPMLSAYSSTSSGKPTYHCATAGVGYIAPDVGASSVTLKAEEYDEFSYYTSSGRQSVLVYSEKDAIKKMRIYLFASGGSASVESVGTKTGTYSTNTSDYVAFRSDDYDVTYTDEDGNDGIGKSSNGYIELTFATPLEEGTFVYVVLKKNAKFFGAKLIESEGGGTGETKSTTLTWASAPYEAPATFIEKDETALNFTYTATRSGANAEASLGTIVYYSSDESVATVNASTGEVSIADDISWGDATFKDVTITAMLSASGCYEKAELSYTVRVKRNVCEDAQGTIAVTSSSCSSWELAISGYAAGATISWYKEGEVAAVKSGNGSGADTYSATTAGTYYAVTNANCDAISTNEIKVSFTTATAKKIVDSWYVKNGRRTPDIALVQTTNATGFTVTTGSPASDITSTGIGGCTFELKEDGIIYLHGTTSTGAAPSGMTPGDMTITITATACTPATSLDIVLHIQAETTKPSVAFVVDGTLRKDGGTATSVSEAKTSERPIWKYLTNSFALTGCNAYWSVDSKELRQYYSQFDAILITDDPSTTTNGTGGVSYVKAFGTMVDVRPLLTMEAYVGKFKDGGWHVYDATPTSPNPRQVEMKLECKNHDIFKGLDPATSDNVRTTTDALGNEHWHVIMVDTTVAPYHNTSKDYKDLPALQGFDKTKFDHMLGVGTIAEETLQGGVERQEEPAARMMILGIQNEAMAALTNEGKLIVKNAIEYLLKTNMEDVNDCANYFTDETGDHLWNTDGNWSSGQVPDFESRVRILRPVVISGGTKAIAARVDIATRGASKHVTGECNGSVTINPTGALIVGGKIRRAEAPRFGVDDLMPTENDDLIVEASTTDPHNQGALIFDNSDGDTHAVVEMWNPSHWEVEGGKKKKKYWSYVAVPIQEADIPNFFWDGFTYLYDETSGWIRKGDGTSLYPFQGIGASLQDGNMETFYGPLATTENQDITLTYTAGIGQGMNLIGNSWTAPIQIANFEEDDFGDAAAEIWVFNTGNTNAGHTTVTDGSSGTTTAGQWQTIPIGVAGLPGYTGLKVIPAMQAFEVNTESETTLHLDYDRLVRAGRENLNEPMRAPRRSAAKQIEATMRVRVSGESTHTDVYLLKDARFSDGFDNGWDGHYLFGDDRSAQLYAISEAEGELAFLAQPEIEGTQLGFAPSKHGNEYTFSFSYDGDEEYYLNDIKLQKSTQIDAENKYLFTYEEGDANRFFISRQPLGVPEVATGNDAVKEDIKAIKIIYNDKLYIIRAGRVYSAEGILVK